MRKADWLLLAIGFSLITLYSCEPERVPALIIKTENEIAQQR